MKLAELHQLLGSASTAVLHPKAASDDNCTPGTFPTMPERILDLQSRAKHTPPRSGYRLLPEYPRPETLYSRKWHTPCLRLVQYTISRRLGIDPRLSAPGRRSWLSYLLSFRSCCSRRCLFRGGGGRCRLLSSCC